MTALKQFQRLEAQGVWRETPASPPRDVIVSVGDATLILSDPREDLPLAHWSLPATVRRNPGARPAVYSPRAQGPDETVQIDDALMIEAIDKVQTAIAASRAHPGRLRGVLTVLAAIAVIAGAVWWLPDALIRHAARIAPPAQARAIGEAVLDDMTRATGPVCARRSGQQVMDWLTPRLLSDDSTVRILPAPLTGARRLPGDLYALGLDLVQTSTGPEVAAGHLLAARQAQDPGDVLRDALRHAGMGGALRLLTFGALPDGAMDGYGQQLLTEATPRPVDGPLLAAFREAGVPSEPYARSIDPTGASVLPLIEGDPFRQAPPDRPLLTDEQWLALQQICAG